MIWRFLIFIFFFFTIYGGINFYVFFRLKPIFPSTPGWKAGIIGFYLLVSFTPLLVRLLERVPGVQAVARGLAYVGYTWMGMLVFLLFIFLGIDVVRLGVVVANRVFATGWSAAALTSPKAVAVILGITGLIILYGFWEANRITPEKILLTSGKIPPAEKPLVIVQISDLHLGQLVGKRKLARALKIVKEAQPDLVVCTGDLVDEDMRGSDHLGELFQQVNPRLGKYMVIGNHEIFAGLEQAIAFIEKAGFILLRNERVKINDFLWLAGVDDQAGHYLAKLKTVSEQQILAGVPEEAYSIFLKHTPHIRPELTGMFDLMLAGHTHQGQILPFSLFTSCIFKYHSGLYTTDTGSKIYVSRGTGTWGPPLRVGAPPEVTVIELVHKD